MSIIHKKPERKKVFLAMGYYERERHFGIAEYARKANWDLNSWMCHTGKLPTGKCDGIISLHCGGFHREILDFLISHNVPTVETSVSCDEFPTPVVRFDDRVIAELAAEHFIERGFENIFFILYGDSIIEQQRFAAFVEVLEEKGKHCNAINLTDLKHWKLPADKWMKNFAEIINRFPKPSAVFLENDRKAYEVCVAAKLAGIQIPEQLAVLGTDNDEIFALTSPVPFSTIDGNLYQTGYQAAELLDKMMQGAQIPNQMHRVKPKGLIVRQSTDILAIPHTDTARALRYIWENFKKPISIPDIAEAVGMSRQHLHKLFVEHLGRSMHDELLRLRLKEAKKLLRQTDTKLEAISRQIGFSSGDRLGKIFKTKFGITPRQYRLNQKQK